MYCLAPEIVKNTAYDFKIDSWSFGVMLYHLLTGQPHIKDVTDLKSAKLKLDDFKVDLLPFQQRQISNQA